MTTLFVNTTFLSFIIQNSGQYITKIGELIINLNSKFEKYYNKG